MEHPGGTEAYLQRMSPELREAFTALTPAEKAAVMRAVVRFHEVMEQETFLLIQGILLARSGA